jgi:hypothetical protein
VHRDGFADSNQRLHGDFAAIITAEDRGACWWLGRAPSVRCWLPARLPRKRTSNISIASELARPAGFEPATRCLEGSCSIRLSYGRPVTIVHGKDHTLATRRSHSVAPRVTGRSGSSQYPREDSGQYYRTDQPYSAPPPPSRLVRATPAVAGSRIVAHSRSHSHLVIGRSHLWRCSWHKPGQNDGKNAGSAPYVLRSVRMVRRLPGTGARRPSAAPGGARAAVPPGAPRTRAPPVPGLTRQQRACRPAKIPGIAQGKSCGPQPSRALTRPHATRKRPTHPTSAVT